MIINGKTLLAAAPIENMLSHKARAHGTSYGLCESTYDVRIAETIWLFPGRSFVLAHTIERFHLPDWLRGKTLNKSTWARLKIDASHGTNLEPGWSGHLTLEISYGGWKPICIPAGAGIVQIEFSPLAEPASYSGGKYDNQPARPVKAILE